MDEIVEINLLLLEKLEIMLNSEIEKEIHGINLKGRTIQYVLDELNEKNKTASLESLGELLKGKGIPKAEVVDSGYPCIRYGELYTKHHRIIRKFYSHINEDYKTKSLRLHKNDIIFAGSGETITEIGKSASFVDEVEAYVGSDTLVFRPHDMDGIYLGYLMNSQLVRQQLNKYGTGATVMHIYNSDLKKVKIPVRLREEQELIGKRLDEISKNIQETKFKIATSKSLQKSLINQIF